MKNLILILSLLAAFTGAAQAATIQEQDAVKAIMGEARGGGKTWDDWCGKKLAMRAVAEAIRNRGHLKGVYGHGASNSDPAWVRRKCEQLAREAWRESAKTKKKIVGRAQYWGALKLDDVWIAAMERAGYVRTAVVGRNAFYFNPKQA